MSAMATTHSAMVVVTGSCRMAALAQAHATGSDGSTNTISATASIVSRGRSLHMVAGYERSRKRDYEFNGMIKQDRRERMPHPENPVELTN